MVISSTFCIERYMVEVRAEDMLKGEVKVSEGLLNVKNSFPKGVLIIVTCSNIIHISGFEQYGCPKSSLTPLGNVLVKQIFEGASARRITIIRSGKK